MHCLQMAMPLASQGLEVSPWLSRSEDSLGSLLLLVALGLTMKELFVAEGSAFVLMSAVCFDTCGCWSEAELSPVPTMISEGLVSWPTYSDPWHCPQRPVYFLDLPPSSHHTPSSSHLVGCELHLCPVWGSHPGEPCCSNAQIANLIS